MEITKKFQEYEKILDKSKKDLDTLYKDTLPQLTSLTEQEMQLDMKKASFYQQFTQKEHEDR